MDSMQDVDLATMGWHPVTFIRPSADVPEHRDKWAGALGKDTVYDRAAEWAHIFGSLNSAQRGLWHQAADEHARQKGASCGS